MQAESTRWQESWILVACEAACGLHHQFEYKLAAQTLFTRMWRGGSEPKRQQSLTTVRAAGSQRLQTWSPHRTFACVPRHCHSGSQNKLPVRGVTVGCGSDERQGWVTVNMRVRKLPNLRNRCGSSAPKKAEANCTRGPATFAMGVFGAADGALQPGIAVELCGALAWLSLGYAAGISTSPLGLRSFMELL